MHPADVNLCDQITTIYSYLLEYMGASKPAVHNHSSYLQLSRLYNRFRDVKQSKLRLVEYRFVL